MEITEIREKILNDDEFVLAEIDKIATYYNLKHTPRWAHERNQDEVESVAEHIYGMHLLADYFLPLMEEEFVIENVRHLITWHDMAEALVGDMTSKHKTDEHKVAEKEAEQQIVKDSPTHLTKRLDNIYSSFDQMTNIEAKFVKAIDKIEPMFHMYFLSTKSDKVHSKFNLGWSSDEYFEYRKPYFVDFPLIKRFDDILKEHTTQFHPS